MYCLSQTASLESKRVYSALLSARTDHYHASLFSQASVYNPDLPIVKRPVNSSLKRLSQKLTCSRSPAYSVRRNRSSRFGGKRIGFALSAKILAGVFGVDLEEVVEDDQ